MRIVALGIAAGVGLLVAGAASAADYPGGQPDYDVQSGYDRSGPVPEAPYAHSYASAPQVPLVAAPPAYDPFYAPFGAGPPVYLAPAPVVVVAPPVYYGPRPFVYGAPVVHAGPRPFYGPYGRLRGPGWRRW